VCVLLLKKRYKANFFLWDLDVTPFDVLLVSDSILLFSGIEVVVLMSRFHNVGELWTVLCLVCHVDVFVVLGFLMWEDRHYQTKIGTEVGTDRPGNGAADT
jgi:uncharacterized membrane protein SirB2